MGAREAWNFSIVRGSISIFCLMSLEPPMKNRSDSKYTWGEPIYSYSRAQAIADGVLVDLTTATDEAGQRLCQQAGFKVPVAMTRAAWAKTIEAGGTWKPSSNGEILELSNEQSLTGRLWDVLWLLRSACDRSSSTDRVHFQVLVDVHGDGHQAVVNLWAICSPGDDANPVITILLEEEN